MSTETRLVNAAPSANELANSDEQLAASPVAVRPESSTSSGAAYRGPWTGSARGFSRGARRRPCVRGRRASTPAWSVEVPQRSGSESVRSYSRSGNSSAACRRRRCGRPCRCDARRSAAPDSAMRASRCGCRAVGDVEHERASSTCRRRRSRSRSRRCIRGSVVAPCSTVDAIGTRRRRARDRPATNSFFGVPSIGVFETGVRPGAGHASTIAARRSARGRCTGRRSSRSRLRRRPRPGCSSRCRSSASLPLPLPLPPPAVGEPASSSP